MKVTGKQKRIQEAFLKEYREINGNFTMVQNRLFTEGHIAKMQSAGLTYLSLLQHCNKTTGQCNPSMEAIAKEIGSSRQTVSTHIDKLVDLGYIMVLQDGPKRMKGGRGGCKSDVNEYILVPLNLVGKYDKEDTTAQVELVEKVAEAKVTRPTAPVVTAPVAEDYGENRKEQVLMGHQVDDNLELMRACAQTVFKDAVQPEQKEFIAQELHKICVKHQYHRGRAINALGRYVKECRAEGRDMGIGDILDVFEKANV